MKRNILFMMVFVLFATIANAQQTTTHVVQRGETPERIVQKYNVLLEELLKANPGAENLYYVGMKLNIPSVKIEAVKSSSPSAETTSTTSPSSSAQNAVSQSASPLAGQSQSTNLGKKTFDPSDYTFWGANYVAPFKFPETGIAGFTGNVFGIYKGIGLTLNVGWQFSGITEGGGGCRAGIGPNFCLPLSEQVFVFAPVCGDLYAVTDDNHDLNFTGGISSTPSIGYKYKKVFASAGFFFYWTKGVNKFYPGFSVSLGYDL